MLERLDDVCVKGGLLLLCVVVVVYYLHVHGIDHKRYGNERG